MLLTILPPDVLTTLSSQIIDHSHFSAKRDLALDDKAEHESCRHQLGQFVNGLGVKWRMQGKDQALFVMRDDERGRSFE